jgi:hypothetical protein
MEHNFSTNIESHSAQKISAIFIGTFQNVTGKKVNVYLPSLMMKVKRNPATGLVAFGVLVG